MQVSIPRWKRETLPSRAGYEGGRVLSRLSGLGIWLADCSTASSDEDADGPDNAARLVVAFAAKKRPSGEQF